MIRPIRILCVLFLLTLSCADTDGFAFSFGRHPGPAEWSQFNTASLDVPHAVASRGSAFSTSCVPIPHNMSLCHGLQYQRMRLPNLLEHDTIDEVLEQSSSWVHLKKLKCHPDTQKFLCSLFAPVCLETPIYPCKSLCESVRTSCESSMLKFGYPWPEMVNCDKFPEGDMCVTAGNKDDGESAVCRACSQLANSESLFDNYCRADFVIRARSRRAKDGSVLKTKMSRIFKVTETIISKKDLRSPEFKNANMSQCCSGLNRKILKKKPHLLVMGTQDGDGNLVPTFIMEWKRGSDAFKKSIKKMQKINCASPAVVESNPLDPVTGRKTLYTKKDQQHDLNTKSLENDKDSIEAKKEQPRIQFDLSENFRRELELHNIAAQQERAREEGLARKDKRRKDKRRKTERKKPEAPSIDEEPEVPAAEVVGEPKTRRRVPKRKMSSTTTETVAGNEESDLETSTEAAHHKGHRGHPFHDLTYHKQANGELGMVVEPQAPNHDEIKVEKKIDLPLEHSTTHRHEGHRDSHQQQHEGHLESHSEHPGNHESHPVHHKVHGEGHSDHSTVHRDSTKEREYNKASHRVHLAKGGHHHREGKIVAELMATTEVTTEEDYSGRKAHHQQHEQVKVIEGDLTTQQPEKPHEIRHDEHSKTQREHHHEMKTTPSPEETLTMLPAKEDFITVLPVIPEHLRDDTEDATETDDVLTSEVIRVFPTTLQTTVTTETFSEPPTSVPRRGRKRKNGRRRHHKKKKKDEGVETAPQEE